MGNVGAGAEHVCRPEIRRRPGEEQLRDERTEVGRNESRVNGRVVRSVGPKGAFFFVGSEGLTTPPESVKRADDRPGERMGWGWCTGKSPQGTDLDRIKAALARMKALGGGCAALADLGTTLLTTERVRISAPVTDDPWSWNRPSAQASSIGGKESGYLWLQPMWTQNHYDAATKRVLTSTFSQTLQSTLAHELDHLDGKDHSPGSNNWWTPNQFICDDIPD